MDLRLDLAQETDAPVIADILTRAVQYKLKHGDSSWGDQPYTVAEILPGINHSEVYIAKLDGKAVGTLKMQWHDDIVWHRDATAAAYIHQLAIQEGYHGRGMGKQLLNLAASQAAARGKRLLRLDCNDQNQKLCEYYEKLGFKQVGIKSIPTSDNYTAALFERKI